MSFLKRFCSFLSFLLPCSDDPSVAREEEAVADDVAVADELAVTDELAVADELAVTGELAVADELAADATLTPSLSTSGQTAEDIAALHVVFFCRTRFRRFFSAFVSAAVDLSVTSISTRD